MKMESSKNGYKLSSTNDREWSRELGDTEYPMVQAIGGDRAKSPGKRRENLLIHATAQIDTTSISIEDLSIQFRSAWTALRLLHSPDIACEFEGEKKIYRSPTDSKELQRWLDRTLEVIIIKDDENIKQAKETIIKRRQDRIELLPTCSIILHNKTPHVVEGIVILFISHWRIEASGALALIDRFIDITIQLVQNYDHYIKALKEYKFDGNEVDKLTPTVEDALMLDTKSSSSISKERVANRIKEMSEKMSRNLQVAITNDGNNAGKMPYKINERVYSTSFTSTLIDRCKKENISVTSAIHAAYLCALYREAIKDDTINSKNISYASIMPAQVRTRIDDGRSPLRKQGCWNAALMLFLALDLVPTQDEKLNLFTIAKSLKQQYQIASQKEWLYEDARETSEQLIEFFTKTIGNAAVNQAKTATPYFTSLGILDKEIINKFHGNEKVNIKIHKVSAWADSIASGMVMRVWTFDDKLNIQLTSNQAWHKEEQIEKLLNQTQEELKNAFAFHVCAEEVLIDAY